MGRKLSLKNSVRIVKLGLTTLCTGNLHLLRRGVEDELDDDGSSSEEEDDGGSIEEEEDCKFQKRLIDIIGPLSV